MLSSLLSGKELNAKKDVDSVKSWITDGPVALKALCFLACLASCCLSILTCIGSLFSPPTFVIAAYTALLSLIGMLLEVKPIVCTRQCKRRIEFWLRALSRVWGRAFLYILIGCLLFSVSGLLSLVCGFGMIFVGTLSLIVSHTASVKLNRLHRSLTAGGEKDENVIRNVFEENDCDGNGTLDATELAIVARKLGVQLSLDELRAVVDVLDVDGSGKIDYAEFRAWWRGGGEVDYASV